MGIDRNAGRGSSAETPRVAERSRARAVLAHAAGAAAGRRVWHRCGTRYRLRLENLGPGGAIYGVRVFPLPRGALVDWNKGLPARLRFDAEQIAITAATGRVVLDALASLRIALPSGIAEHAELVLEFDLVIEGQRVAAVTTFTLEADPQRAAR